MNNSKCFKVKRLCFLALVMLLMFSFMACSVETPPKTGNVLNGTEGNEQQESDNTLQKPDNEQQEPDNTQQEPDSEPTVLEFVTPTADYQAVMAPIQKVMLDILADLDFSGKINLSGYSQPMLDEIRFTYGTDLWVTISDTMMTAEKGELSQFLEKSVCFNLEDIGEHYSEQYELFRVFLNQERSLRNKADYIEKLLPMAVSIANTFSEMYEDYKSEGKTPQVMNFSNKLTLKKDSLASFEYEELRQKINTYLSAEMAAGKIPVKTPLMENADIEISFGGNIYDEVVFSRITLEIKYNNYTQMFFPRFNADGRFSEEYINRFTGYVHTGYVPDCDSVAENEGYPNFFKKIVDSLAFSGDIFDTFDGEDTCLKMPSVTVFE